MQSISPCPECGGTREFFKCSGDASIRISLGMLNWLTLSALICLDCGYTTLRPHPAELAYIRGAVKRK